MAFRYPQLHTAEDAWCKERDAMIARIIELNEELAEEREKRQRADEALQRLRQWVCQLSEAAQEGKQNGF
jgi:hypothetical protein